MADFNFSDVASKIQPPPQMSLADMVNLARGAQAYQQAQQTNPLALRQQQAETEFSEQQKPLLLRKSGAEATLAESTLQPNIEKAIAESKRSNVQLNSEQVKNLREQLSNHSRNLLGLLHSDEPITPKKLKDFTLDALKNTDASVETIAQELKFLPKTGSDKELRAFLAKHATDALSAEAQIDKLYPAASLQNLGGNISALATGNPALANIQPGTKVGQGVTTTIAPQVSLDPITRQPRIIGGNQGLQPTAPTMSTQGGAQNASQGGIGGILPPQLMSPSMQGAQLSQGANESPENFNARVANVQNDYTKALSQYNNPNSEYGHIPTIKSINSNILTALKDPSVTTGAIADILAKKTNKGSMNAKEQELSKYLEQRIQNLGPRTDQAAVNLKNAYGSTNLDKEALMNLIRQDNVWVTTQELKTKGILHNGGSQINPNYNAISGFNQQFAQFAQNPELMRYVSLVGENARMKTPDKHDLKELHTLVGPMNQKQREDLEAQRQALVKLIKGQ